MIWPFETHAHCMAREAELWRRSMAYICALDRHVLEELNPRDLRRQRFLFCLGLTLVLTLGLVLLLIVQRPPPFDVPLEQANAPDGVLDGGLMLAAAILLKLFAAATLALCVLNRFRVLAAANMALVAACLVLTMGGFGLFATEPAPSALRKGPVPEGSP